MTSRVEENALPAQGSRQPLQTESAGSRTWFWLLLVIMLALHLGAAYATDFLPQNFGNLRNIARFAAKLWPPDVSIIRSQVLPGALVTLATALLGATIPLILAFPLAFLGARNVSPATWVYRSVRTLFAFLRGVPDLVWLLVYVVAVGFGPLPAVLGLSTLNLGVLGRAFAELIESADPGQLEAVAATGAPWPLVVWYGVVPQIGPGLLAQAFARFEFNVRAATIVGFVGGGGIGNDLTVAFRLFDYHAVATYMIAILIMVLGAEALANALRRRVQ